jgi:hypothetical protein
MVAVNTGSLYTLLVKPQGATLVLLIRDRRGRIEFPQDAAEARDAHG